jgi:arylsulfatase A-like enzyme
MALVMSGNLLQAHRPNVVIYLADDQSYVDMSVSGAVGLKTPTAELLAHAGMTFTNAFVASPACAPSRAALLTGLMPSRNGAEANHTYPRPGTLVLTKKLQESGYKVLGFGKVAHEKMNRECGFDFYSEPRIHLFDHVTEYFKGNPPNHPVCLMVGDRRPHVPWTSKSIYDPSALKLPSYFIDTKETREHWAAYYSDITGMDDEMGKVFNLAKEKFGENFIFIYSADNGRQWPFGKWNLYETGIKVPLIIVWPGHILPHSRADAMVSWIDIFPTLLDVTGCEIPRELDGKSFRKVLEGKRDLHREYIFTTHSGDVKMNVYPIRSVRDSRFKYIRNLEPGSYHSNHSDILRKPGAGEYWDSWDDAADADAAAAAILQRYYIRPPEEFYDLLRDPDEQQNLISDGSQQARIKKMRKLLDDWMKEQKDSQKTFQKPYPASGPRPHLLGIKE